MYQIAAIKKHSAYFSAEHFVLQNSLSKICYLVSRRHTHHTHIFNLLPLENAARHSLQCTVNVMCMLCSSLYIYAIFGLHFAFLSSNSHKYSHFPVLIISCLQNFISPFPRTLAFRCFEYAKLFVYFKIHKHMKRGICWSLTLL